MQEEGREYQLVLRGDPVSGTSLLSTTIQAAMLQGRILDPLADSPSADAFSRKAFLFTDDLDVTNRLYHDLLDAEGRTSWGRENHQKLPLATYRGPQWPRRRERFRLGQDWALCEWIGHALVQPPERLYVSRTSSQDRGVDPNAQIIVASPSLEVGYDDRQVGAVIQHKAPRDPASFLQRKGHAGRLRATRPWTIVVLSDYGRDRLAYQAYDQLFDPSWRSRRSRSRTAPCCGCRPSMPSSTGWRCSFHRIWQQAVSGMISLDRLRSAIPCAPSASSGPPDTSARCS